MNHLKRYWDLTLAIILTVALTCIALRSPAKAVSDGYIEIEAHNTSPFTILIEAKCDWNNNTKQFDFHQFYKAPSKSVAIIIVPSKHKHCQVWSKVKFLENK